MTQEYFVYILTNKRKGVLYVGSTYDLYKRVYEHKTRAVMSFTSKYNINRLVYYEIYDDLQSALRRERRLKKWYRNWKIELIEKENPKWLDLSIRWFEGNNKMVTGPRSRRGSNI